MSYANKKKKPAQATPGDTIPEDTKQQIKTFKEMFPKYKSSTNDDILAVFAEFNNNFEAAVYGVMNNLVTNKPSAGWQSVDKKKKKKSQVLEATLQTPVVEVMMQRAAIDETIEKPEVNPPIVGPRQTDQMNEEEAVRVLKQANPLAVPRKLNLRLHKQSLLPLLLKSPNHKLRLLPALLLSQFLLAVRGDQGDQRQQPLHPEALPHRVNLLHKLLYKKQLHPLKPRNPPALQHPPMHRTLRWSRLDRLGNPRVVVALLLRKMLPHLPSRNPPPTLRLLHNRSTKSLLTLPPLNSLLARSLWR